MERAVILHIVYIGDEYNAERRLLNICNSRARLVARVLKIRVKNRLIFRVFAAGRVSDGNSASFRRICLNC